MTSVMMERKCIAIVGGHELWREAICLLLARIMPRATVFDSPDEKDPVFNRDYVDLILFFLCPPYLIGMELLVKLRHRFPIVPLVLISDAEGSIADITTLTRGVNRLPASASIEDLVTMIAEVLDGKMILPKGNSKKLKFSGSPLSPRQMDVFILLCQGRTNKEIGSVLGMSDNTVRTHVSAIFDLLGVRNRTEAAALGRNLIGILLCLSAVFVRYQVFTLLMV